MKSTPEKSLNIKSGLTDKEKKESLERLVNAYHQAKADGKAQQIKILEAVLKRLGYTRFKG